MEIERSKNNDKPKKNSSFVTAIRSEINPAVAALISRDEASEGNAFLYFELSRSFRSKSTGNTGYSKKLFACNADAAKEVVERAAAWIDAHPEAAEPGWKAEAKVHPGMVVAS